MLQPKYTRLGVNEKPNRFCEAISLKKEFTNELVQNEVPARIQSDEAHAAFPSSRSKQ
jgi:hypothetical protein